ncbi:MAG: DUF502 domain-containing protein [Phycisphaerales bacterium]
MADQPTTFSGDFKRFFGRGLAILLPSILTLWILWTASVFVYQSVALPINAGIRRGLIEVSPLVMPAEPERQPAWYRLTPERRTQHPGKADREIRAAEFHKVWDAYYLWATGLIVAIVLIYLAGVVLGGLLGRRAYLRAEALISRLPGFKQVYPHVKQLVDLVMGERPMAFKRVVMVEYPRAGIWTLGLVTSNSLRIMTERTGQRFLTIFIPSTPTPFTGFTINVPEAAVIDVPMSVDEAIRFVLTGGALIPDRMLPDAAPGVGNGDDGPVAGLPGTGRGAGA